MEPRVVSETTGNPDVKVMRAVLMTLCLMAGVLGFVASLILNYKFNAVDFNKIPPAHELVTRSELAPEVAQFNENDAKLTKAVTDLMTATGGLRKLAKAQMDSRNQSLAVVVKQMNQLNKRVKALEGEPEKKSRGGWFRRGRTKE